MGKRHTRTEEGSQAVDSHRWPHVYIIEEIGYATTRDAEERGAAEPSNKPEYQKYRCQHAMTDQLNLSPYIDIHEHAFCANATGNVKAKNST